MAKPWTLAPLRANRLDQRLYVRRASDDALARALGQQLNVLLLGERGSGKTTALNHCAYRMRRTLDLRIIRAADIGDGVGLVRRIAEKALDNPVELAAVAPMRSLVTELIERAEHEENATGAGGRQLVLAVDGAPPAAVWQLFGAHRDELWQLGGTWVVTGEPSFRAELLRPPADSVFHMDLLLSGLDTPAAAAELVQRRVRESDRAVTVTSDELDRLVAVTDGNPRRLLQLVSQVLAADSPPPDTLAAAEAERNRQIQALGRAPAMLVAELANIGQASASDELLLERLGWTRPRAAKVLSQLEAAGLVTSTDRRTGAGRPRRVFTLVGAEAFANAQHGES